MSLLLATRARLKSFETSRLLGQFRAWLRPGHTIDDQWRVGDNVSHRDALSQEFLSGQGLEIGGLHKPVKVRESVRVRYVDYKTRAENYQRYPELANEPIVATDIVDDGFILDRVPDASVDFIVANHALEHSPDPYGTLLLWKRKLAERGVLYAAVPIAEKCYDKGRPTTTLDHLVEDHQCFLAGNVPAVLERTRHHLEEFVRVSDRNIRVESNVPQPSEQEILRCITEWIGNLEGKLLAGSAGDRGQTDPYKFLITTHVENLNRVYDIHYHTFSPSSYHKFLRYFAGAEGMKLKACRKSGGGECIGILAR